VCVAACIPQVIYREMCIHVCVYFGRDYYVCVCVGLVPLQVSKIKDNGMLERVRPRSSGLSHSEHRHFVQWTPCPEIQMCDISENCLTNGQFLAAKITAQNVMSSGQRQKLLWLIC
jgi:hypothetical protein